MTEPVERKIAEWSDRPYTAVRKRHHTVRHRILVVWYPEVGVDVRHEIKSEDRGIETWTSAETWEMRSHGTDKVTSEAGRGLP